MRKLSITMLIGLFPVCGCAVEPGDDALIEGQGDETVVEVEQALPANKGIILIDRTGSMVAIRSSTGHSRCRDARAQALQKTAQFFAPETSGGLAGSSLSVWTFNGSTVTQLTGYVNQSTAQNAINGLSMEGCTGSTPLADAICQAADQLNLYWNGINSNRLTILTDGGENNSVGVCAGNANDLTDPTSWRYKARAKVNSYFPRVIVSTSFWTGATYITAKGIDPETGKPFPTSSGSDSASAVTCTDQSVCDHNLFLALPVDSGGTYDLVKDNNPQYPCTNGACPPPYYQETDW